MAAPTAQAPSTAAGLSPSTGPASRGGFSFNITSNRSALLEAAGTLGGTVAGGGDARFFQATVPTVIPRAGLAQLSQGQVWPESARRCLLF